MISLSIMQWGTSDGASQQNKQKKREKSKPACCCGQAITAHYWPLCHSSVSDLGQSLQLPKRTKEAPESTQAWLGGTGKKAVNDLDGRNTPLGITGGDSGQQPCLGRGKREMQGKRTDLNLPGGDEWAAAHPPAECHLRKAGHAASPGHWLSHLHPVTALGTACATCLARIPTLCCLTLSIAWKRGLSWLCGFLVLAANISLPFSGSGMLMELLSITG